eukprot:CAMPEP_0176442252 /NCGR_PEP_ID=MMETSP0127-20121128/21698_1 /TAXON_ID=938130 /ORGANISM="Platyophrya macrostoma, Strain WH" /LENGTH=273 /DNA_ID=CAMNT_0017827217 /DNA_START=56 /DNA_END=875 /DNA_ORIENTATION=+
MELLEQARRAAISLKDKYTKTQLERDLTEATSSENWNAPTKVLQNIAEHSYNFDDFATTVKHIWAKLNSDRTKWRRILKTMTLIEYLLKNGSPKAVQEFKDEIYQIRAFQNYSHYEEAIEEELQSKRKRKKFEGFGSNSTKSGGSRGDKDGNYGGMSNKDVSTGGFGSFGGGVGTYDDSKVASNWRKNTKDDEPVRKPKPEDTKPKVQTDTHVKPLKAPTGTVFETRKEPISILDADDDDNNKDEFDWNKAPSTTETKPQTSTTSTTGGWDWN